MSKIRKILALVYALVVTSCWAQEPTDGAARAIRARSKMAGSCRRKAKPISDSTSYGACIMRDGSVSGINENERFCYAQRDEVPAGVIRRRLPELGVQDMNDAGVILMPNGSHVIIAIFATHSPPEAVIANIARQMLKQ